MKKRNEKIKVPFHPIIIPLFSILFTFLVGGMVAGLNWTRLNRPKWKYPTIGFTTLGFIIFLVLYSLAAPLISKYIIYVTYIIFGAVGFLFYYIQKPYYERWKNGKI